MTLKPNPRNVELAKKVAQHKTYRKLYVCATRFAVGSAH